MECREGLINVRLIITLQRLNGVLSSQLNGISLRLSPPSPKLQDTNVNQKVPQRQTLNVNANLSSLPSMSAKSDQPNQRKHGHF